MTLFGTGVDGWICSDLQIPWEREGLAVALTTSSHHQLLHETMKFICVVLSITNARIFTPVTQFNPPSLGTLRKMGSASGPWLNYRVVQLRSYLLTSWLLLFALSSLNCPRVVVSLVEPAEPSKPRHQQCRANAHNLPVNLHRWTTSPLLNKSQRKIPSAKFALSKTP